MGSGVWAVSDIVLDGGWPKGVRLFSPSQACACRQGQRVKCDICGMWHARPQSSQRPTDGEAREGPLRMLTLAAITQRTTTLRTRWRHIHYTPNTRWNHVTMCNFLQPSGPSPGWWTTTAAREGCCG